MFLRNLPFAAALSVACAAPVVAAPVEIDFSFDQVSGTFYGLDDAIGTSNASSFDLDGRFDVYTDVSTDSADCNEFTFDASGLSQACFSIENVGQGESGTGVLETFAILINANGLFGSVEETPSSGSQRSIVPTDLSVRGLPVTAVPLPAGPLLLFTGIAAIGGLRFRKKPVGQA